MDGQSVSRVHPCLRFCFARPTHTYLGFNAGCDFERESRYRLMPGIWQALIDSGTPGSILTKSPLLLRDIELMKQVPGIRANLSIPTMEEKAWRATEPHTPSPMKRMEAVAELNRAGIPLSLIHISEPTRPY